MNSLTLNDVCHCFGNIVALDHVSLALAPGELVSLVGPSGCGKSTLLRLAAGLEELQHGEVLIGNLLVARAGEAAVPPEDREIGLVFQDYALFPHLTARSNVAFGLAHMPAAARNGRVQEALAQVGMGEFADAFVTVLSGGQQQRIALARALAPRPRIILLDEPFSGLDARLRRDVRDETLHLLKSAGVTTLLVTHDPEEAMFMADRVALMRAGRIAQIGTPVELYYQPQTPFAAEFFGEINRIAGVVDGGRVATPLGSVPADGMADGALVEVHIRPEAVQLRRLADCEATPSHTAVVMAARLLGRTSLVHLSLTGGAGGPPLHVHARVPGRFLPAENDIVGLHLDGAQTFVFPRSDPK